ncbi:MAG: hypothetical protein IKQ17_11655, partial [Kiritimatiellae bacterium]|nr:hypothetical protein [Kiritimatiellia bacterium]
MSKLGRGVFGADVEKCSMQRFEALFPGIKRKTNMKKLIALAAVAACGAALAVESANIVGYQ